MSRPAPDRPAAPAPPPPPPLALLALGTAVCVSTIYLSQPILNLLGLQFHASIRQMGGVTTATQVGYALGILFVVPLGDVFAKRGLILAKLGLVTAALVATGLATSVTGLLAGSLVIGVAATAAQDFLPLAAELSPPDRRGAAIGFVMGGLLLGILGSRTFSGVIADAAGWRAPFFLSAAMAVLLAVLVWRRVPHLEQAHDATYPALIRSMGSLVRAQPLLRLASLGHGLIGVGFSAFWTMISFHLGAAPFALRPAQVGLFALAGVAGAAIAPVAGRLADRHGPLFNIRVGLALVTASFASMLVFPSSLAALAVAAVAFDLGIQLSMVSHQAIIYSLDPRARSRLNAVYVGVLFGFFALGSALAGWAFGRWGWNGVVALCLTSVLLSAAVHAALSRRWHARPAAAT